MSTIAAYISILGQVCRVHDGRWRTRSPEVQELLDAFGPLYRSEVGYCPTVEGLDYSLATKMAEQFGGRVIRWDRPRRSRHVPGRVY